MIFSYSVAIRTLGTSGENFVRELDSIAKQTIKPEKVIIYIAKGNKRPPYSIGIEEYVEVPKGMVSQRALDYKEINSEYILMLDDDVELKPNSVEILFNNLIESNADCVVADTFANHKMPLWKKIYNICCNLTFPFYSNTWGRKVLSNGSIAYNCNPKKKFYKAQSGEGPASLWRKETFVSIKYFHELWLDDIGFAYADDQLMFYKLNANGYNLVVSYESKIKHLDSKTASSKYHINSKKFELRSQVSFIIWYRTLYDVTNVNFVTKSYRLSSYFIKQLCVFPIHIMAAIYFKNIKIPYYQITGILNGLKFINSPKYKIIPNYIVSHENFCHREYPL